MSVQKRLIFTVVLLILSHGFIFAASLSATPRDAYFDAEACWRSLRQNSQKMKYRHNWLRCIQKYQSVHEQDPAGPWAAAGMYMSGKLYLQLAKFSGKQADRQQALEIFQRLVGNYPDSRYRPEASREILKSRYQARASEALQSMPQSEPDDALAESDPVAEKLESGQDRQPTADPRGAIEDNGAAHASTRPASGGRVTVTNLRYWSNPNYTRVVIDADRETAYAHHLLKKDPSINKPQRLYVDLTSSRLGENIRKSIPIGDDLLSNARAGQYTPDSVRVVVDIKSFETYKIFSLQDPFRIVIDVWGTKADKDPETPGPYDTVEKEGRIPPGSLAKQLALGVRRVVIDPGHGGKDYGAPGYLKGVHEKEVVLQIARRLARKIREELKLEAVLTRNSDRYLTLEERTAFANTQGADLFISIHTNANRDSRAYGIETYFLNLATDEEAIRVAAMENATSTKNISDLQKILYDLMQNAKINESSRLAAYVQGAVIGHLNHNRYERVKSKGVKQAPFYVLLGAQMPSILVEAAFISNPRECKRLADPKFQDRLAAGILQGIRNYIQATSPTTFQKASRQAESQG